MDDTVLWMSSFFIIVWAWMGITATQLLGLAFYPTTISGIDLPLSALLAGIMSSAIIVVSKKYCTWQIVWWLTRFMPLIVTAWILFSLEGPLHSFPLANSDMTMAMLILLVGVPLIVPTVINRNNW